MNNIFLFILIVSILTCGCDNSTDNSKRQTITVLKSSVASNLTNVFFENAQSGFAVGENGTVITTTDGGITWKRISEKFTNRLNTCYSHNGIRYIGGDGIIAYGENLSNLNVIQNIAITIKSFTALGNGDIIAVGGYTTPDPFIGTVVIKSRNSTTWSALPDSLLSDGVISDVIAIDPSNVMWCVGICKELGFCPKGVKKFDFDLSKESQVLQGNTYGVVSLAKIDSTIVGVGFASDNTNSPLKLIVHSTDNGATWGQQIKTSDNTLLDVAMSSPTIGYACGPYGLLMQTTNAGQSWSVIPRSTTNHLRSIFFPDATTGYAVGDNGTIIKLTSGK